MKKTNGSDMKMSTNEDFFGILDRYIGHVQILYKRYAEKQPIMELSLPSCKIYAYPYADYLKTLSKKSQEILKEEYYTAINHNKMVVFVRDNNERVLKSCSVPIEEIEFAEYEMLE
ncbi:MAG: hypothetical protein KJ936_06035 [Proteobacteria bacterium]|nr:hypothetical protein [Pseudomonadota bacterium]